MATLENFYLQFSELDPVDRERFVVRYIHEIFPMLLPFEWSRWNRLGEFPSIVSTPNVCGGAARLIRTRIPVWTLERMRQLGVSEADILKSFPTLGAADLVQAWTYVSHNREEIEREIRENADEGEQ